MAIIHAVIATLVNYWSDPQPPYRPFFWVINDNKIEQQRRIQARG